MDEAIVLDDGARVQTLLSPIRLRILQLLEEADSATGLARRLELPRQKVNYHLRELERGGFVELAEERPRRGCVERFLKPTARAYLLSPALLGTLAADPDVLRDRFSSAYLVALASQTARDVAEQRRRAGDAGKRLATLALQVDVTFKTPGDRDAFAEELAAAVAGLAARYHDGAPGGRGYRFVVAGHPQPKEQAP